MLLYHPRLIKSTATLLLVLATPLLISHPSQLQLSHMMKIPPLLKEVMLPKALKKCTVHGVTHMLNMDRNGTQGVPLISIRKVQSAGYSS